LANKRMFSTTMKRWRRKTNQAHVQVQMTERARHRVRWMRLQRRKICCDECAIRSLIPSRSRHEDGLPAIFWWMNFPPLQSQKNPNKPEWMT
jgi:hypothetical protein